MQHKIFCRHSLNSCVAVVVVVAIVAVAIAIVDAKFTISGVQNTENLC